MANVINTTVSSMWTSGNPTYVRPVASNGTYYYDTFHLMVSRAGTYDIGSNSAIDTYGFLYNGIFVPENPELNLLIFNDDNNGSAQFGFRIHLRLNVKYTLVATTFSEMQTGPYAVVVSGPERVTLIRTSIPVTTPSAPITDGGNKTNATSK